MDWTEISDPKVVNELVLGKKGIGQLGSSSSSSGSDQFNSARIEAFRADMLPSFLQQDSGTLILVLGYEGAGGVKAAKEDKGKAPTQQEDFQKLLQEVEEYDASIAQGKDAKKKGMPELLLYMRHKTALGQPFTHEALAAGSFPKSQIGTLPGPIFKLVHRYFDGWPLSQCMKIC